MPRVWYHGAQTPRDELRPANPTYSGSLGAGVYLTTERRHALHYGDWVHEVVDPLPEDEILWLEQNFWPCPNDMVSGTPGASPFTFDVVDRKTGKTHRYSVLEACEEEVRASLARDMDIMDNEAFSIAVEEAKEISPDVAKWLKANIGSLVEAVLSDPYYGEWSHIENFVMNEELEQLAEESGMGEEEALDEMEMILQGIEIERLVEAKTDEVLGDIVELYDLAGIAQHHGYSAVYSHHAPSGDELVVFDDDYLPVEVKSLSESEP